jgi:hypothetical protein
MWYDTEFHLAFARSTENRFKVGAIEETRLRLNDVMTLLPESELWHHRISGEQMRSSRDRESLRLHRGDGRQQ